MENKTVKFGGTSLCDGLHMKKAADLIFRDETRKAVVVSAPGKRWEGDEKITDLLLSADKTDNILQKENLLRAVENRFLEMMETLGVFLPLEKEFREMRQATGDFLISRGEYFTGRIMAQYLGYGFLDAASCIFLDGNGKINEEKTALILSEKLRRVGRAVIPGFYGRSTDGQIRLLERGGSDITGALVADAMDSTVYENFTDVDGFLFADPKLVENPVTVSAMSYRELRVLSKNGASVFHGDAVLPLLRREIPVVIRHTANENGASTVISKKRSGGLAGIASEGEYTAVTVQSKESGKKENSLADSVFRAFGIVPTVIQTEGDYTLFLFPMGEIPRAELLAMRLQETLQSEIVTVQENLCKLTVVGENMPPAAVGELYTCLAAFRPVYVGGFGFFHTAYLPMTSRKKAVNALYEKLLPHLSDIR